MLVLTRKIGEVVYVGEDVEVMIVGVSSGKVRLGFRAPRDVAIQRAEVAIDAESRKHDEIALPPSMNRRDQSSKSPLCLFRQLDAAQVNAGQPG